MRRAFCTTPVLQLTPWERRIFTFLTRVAAARNPAPELRVAGGWVRDRLLGRVAGDIDVAVAHATGRQFAEAVHDFASEGGRDAPDVSTVATIPPNPAMSRHLETATLRLDGRDVDFVQLRTEDYACDTPSRVPARVAPGTPEEDAVRRDFTINALFYNLHTRAVEDHTSRGLLDLADEVLVTPLEARTTLLEDPLRCLRALRFACRLGFALHPDLVAAAALPEVRDALAFKVSRERIGAEVLGIVQSPDPVRGFTLLSNLNLVSAVFPETFPGTSFLDGVATLETCLRLATHAHLSDTGRTALVFAAVVGRSDRVNRALRTDLRRDNRLQVAVHTVISTAATIATAAPRWRQGSTAGAWTDVALAARSAGRDLYRSAVLLAAAGTNDDTLLEALERAGLYDAVTVPALLDGAMIRDALGVPAGPRVGAAMHALMRRQLDAMSENSPLSHEEALAFVRDLRMS